MSNVKKPDTGIKVSIPRELYQAILKIQANDGIDFGNAASKAAALIDSNGELFNDMVRFQVYR